MPPELKYHLTYYDYDGQPMTDGVEAWAKLFENTEARIIGQSRTLYGEKLSTVWLGLDHNFFEGGPPLIFETMLFAPRDRDLYRRVLRQLASREERSEEDNARLIASDAYIKKHYPHDQLQLRFSTREEAARNYNRMWWACLIPPRLRRLILYTIGKNSIWS
jgi:hypothetical protein